MPNREALSEEVCRQFSALLLLDRLVIQPGAYHAGLLNDDDALLEENFRYLLAENLAQIGSDDFYQLAPAGRQAYQRMLQQQQSYLIQFDIFAGVDLAEGTFADPEKDYAGDPRWADLRVAVAEYKGIDPYRVVFLGLLAEGSFFNRAHWQFDLALGSNFYTEIEEIVASQISAEELGYESEEGERVSGEAVLEDVILQGAKQVARDMEKERSMQSSLFEEAPEGGENGETGGNSPFVSYNPWPMLASYAYSAAFVDPLWLEPYW